MSLMDKIETFYSSLSKSHQKIARYIRHNCEEAVFQSVTELAQKSDTSPPTVVRFARELGFEGYPDMQQALQGDIVVTRNKANRHDSVTGAASNVSGERLDRACREIMGAKDILIIGYMDAFGTAAELFHRLTCLRDGVQFTRLINDWNDIHKMMRPGTLLLAISYTPHYEYTSVCVSAGCRRGCRVMLFTDSPLNPMTEQADEVLSFELPRDGNDKELNRVDTSSVFSVIHQITCRIRELYPESILPPNRNDEVFID